MENKPNLFKYATNELSQDAFICWLIEWSKVDYSDNTALHETGKYFLKKLIEKHRQSNIPEIKEIEIRTQYKNIDILVLLNSTYALIIEDKVNYYVSSGTQLRNYEAEIEEDNTLKIRKENIIPIYLKTGYQSGFPLNDFKHFLINDFVEVLEYGLNKGITSDIFVDFHNNLKAKNDLVMSFENHSVEEWESKYSENRKIQKQYRSVSKWIGFFIKLQSIFENELNKNFEQWYYRDNKSGGFWSFYWFVSIFENKPISCIHIGIDQKKINTHINEKMNARFNIYISMNKEIEKNLSNKERTLRRTQERNKYHDKIMIEAERQGISLRKPSRFGNGHSMKIAEYEKDVIIQDKNNKVDFSYIKKVIEDIERVINNIETD